MLIQVITTQLGNRILLQRYGLGSGYIHGYDLCVGERYHGYAAESNVEEQEEEEVEQESELEHPEVEHLEYDDEVVPEVDELEEHVETMEPRRVTMAKLDGITSGSATPENTDSPTKSSLSAGKRRSSTRRVSFAANKDLLSPERHEDDDEEEEDMRPIMKGSKGKEPAIEEPVCLLIRQMYVLIFDRSNKSDGMRRTMDTMSNQREMTRKATFSHLLQRRSPLARPPESDLIRKLVR